MDAEFIRLPREPILVRWLGRNWDELFKKGRSSEVAATRLIEFLKQESEFLEKLSQEQELSSVSPTITFTSPRIEA